MQLTLPERLQFNIGPMSFDQVMEKLYPPVRGPYLYRRGPGISGLGCNPGETKDNGDGTQSICGSDGSSWSTYSGAAGTTGNVPNPSDAAPPAQYVAPPPASFQQCQPWDTSCVQGDVAGSVGFQQAEGVAAADQDYGTCMANGNGDAVCRARWPVGYSGDVPFNNLTPDEQAGAMQTPAQASAQYLSNAAATDAQVRAELLKAGQTPAAITQALGPVPNLKPNQSVPPTTPLTPMSTGMQNTGQVLQAQTAGASGTSTSAFQPATGLSSNTLLIVAAAGLGLFLLMKGGAR
jgi:hypothetical protein